MNLGRIAAVIGLLTAFVAAAFLYSPSVPQVATASEHSAPVKKAKDRAPDRFGIVSYGYRVVEDRVERRETFADLLLDHGVEYQDIVRLAEEAKDVYNVRRIQAGKPYRVYQNDWLGRARYLVYQPNAVDYVVFDVRYPERSYRGERPVTTTWRVAEGVIESSLYEALDDAGAHPELALQLSEVFAWQVDFFRIQRGDRFRAVYEEQTVDGERIRPGQVVAAYFSHHGRDYYGFRFDQGEGSEYFDDKAQSMRRQLLKAPLRYKRISSRYKRNRYHPVLKRNRPHLGTDYAAAPGTPVHTVGDGVIIEKGYTRGNGNYVKIRHNVTYTTAYLHLQGFAKGISRGKRVKQGETIGYVGSTGLATGPHLHYSFWKNGRAIDPYTIELPPAYPVQPQNLHAFDRVKATLMAYLAPSQAVPFRAGALAMNDEPWLLF